MTAVDVLAQALATGIRVTRDGDNLVLTASNPPPAWVVEPLKRHKADILTMLSKSTDCSEKARPSLFGSACSIEECDQQQSQSNIVTGPREDAPPQAEPSQPPSTEKSAPQHARHSMPRQFIKPKGTKAVKPVKVVFSAPWTQTQTPVFHGRNRATPCFRDGGIGFPWSTDFGWLLKRSALSGQRSFGNSNWWQKRVVIQRRGRFKLLGTG
jgi:hypothetical protein